MYNNGDIIEWCGMEFKVIEDNDDGTGTVECLGHMEGVWEKGNITYNFTFDIGDGSTLIQKSTNEMTELEYLRLFFQEADFGPAHGDVVEWMNARITKNTGKELPEGYKPYYED